MTLRSLVLCTLVGSALAAWFVRPQAASVPTAIDVGRTCGTTTKKWAERWSSRANDLRRMTVVCRRDGGVAVARVDWRSTDGHRLAAWRPGTTFGRDLPPGGWERIDVIDGAGQLLEYAVFDRTTERLEFYRGSELAGYGQFDSATGSVQRFDLRGRRQTSLPLPIPPSTP